MNTFIERRDDDHECATDPGCCMICRNHDGCSEYGTPQEHYSVSIQKWMREAEYLHEQVRETARIGLQLGADQIAALSTQRDALVEVLGQVALLIQEAEVNLWETYKGDVPDHPALVPVDALRTALGATYEPRGDVAWGTSK